MTPHFSKYLIRNMHIKKIDCSLINEHLQNVYKEMFSQTFTSWEKILHPVMVGRIEGKHKNFGGSIHIFIAKFTSDIPMGCTFFNRPCFDTFFHYFNGVFIQWLSKFFSKKNTPICFSLFFISHLWISPLKPPQVKARNACSERQLKHKPTDV